MDSKETKEVFASQIKRIGLNSLVKKVSEDFIYAKDIVEMLYDTILTGENCVLYGPGGFGKSEITEKTLDICKIPYKKVQCFEGMAPEDLIGPPNMQKLKQESVLEYNFDVSPFGGEHVIILEEMLDARPQTIAVMKDIITSGMFQGRRTKNASIIVCTNTDPKLYYNSPTIKALLSDRFIFKLKVHWESISTLRYETLIARTLPDTSQDIKRFLSNVFFTSHTAGTTVSPRAAVTLTRIVNTVGIEALKFVDDVDSSVLEGMLESRRSGPIVAALYPVLTSYINEVWYSEGTIENKKLFSDYDALFDRVADTGNATLLKLCNKFKSTYINLLQDPNDVCNFKGNIHNPKFYEILKLLEKL